MSVPQSRTRLLLSVLDLWVTGKAQGHPALSGPSQKWGVEFFSKLKVCLGQRSSSNDGERLGQGGGVALEGSEWRWHGCCPRWAKLERQAKEK